MDRIRQNCWAERLLSRSGAKLMRSALVSGFSGVERRTGRRGGPVGVGGGPAGWRPALRGHGRPSRLSVHGSEEAVPARHLQPTEAGASGAPPGAGLHAKAARGGEVNIIEVSSEH